MTVPPGHGLVLLLLALVALAVSVALVLTIGAPGDVVVEFPCMYPDGPMP